jgi:hypothetical protein
MHLISLLLWSKIALNLEQTVAAAALLVLWDKGSEGAVSQRNDGDFTNQLVFRFHF